MKGYEDICTTIPAFYMHAIRKCTKKKTKKTKKKTLKYKSQYSTEWPLQMPSGLNLLGIPQLKNLLGERHSDSLWW